MLNRETNILPEFCFIPFDPYHLAVTNLQNQTNEELPHGTFSSVLRFVSKISISPDLIRTYLYLKWQHIRNIIKKINNAYTTDLTSSVGTSKAHLTTKV